MPITFGSVGDIIAVAQLVKDLIDALDKSRGSSAEYRGLIRDLELLRDVLSQIEQLANAHETTLELAALYETVRRILEPCRLPIEAFRRRVSKYEATLGRGDANKLKAAIYMFRWQVGEKEEVAKLRTQLTGQVAFLNMLLGATNWAFSKSNRSMLNAFETDTRNHLVAQDFNISQLDTALRDQGRLISESKASILGGVQLLRGIGVRVKSILSRMFAVNLATYKAVLSLQGTLLARLERSLAGELFILEDAIGRTAPVSLQFINSWPALEGVLETRFRGIQGHGKIQSGEYVLRETGTGLDISRSRNWEGTFLPGQKMNMSILFQRDELVQETSPLMTTCPFCHRSSTESADAEVHW
ncbi:hypothetical protein LTR85_003059 [Meristemomyces frigidus]|nr:hypothetical protein LTR85_003059 [Meristemomyces frigidus]